MAQQQQQSRTLRRHPGPLRSPATRQNRQDLSKKAVRQPIRCQRRLLLIGTKGLDWCMFTQNLIGNLDLAGEVLMYLLRLLSTAVPGSTEKLQTRVFFFVL